MPCPNGVSVRPTRMSHPPRVTVGHHALVSTLRSVRHPWVTPFTGLRSVGGDVRGSVCSTVVVGHRVTGRPSKSRRDPESPSRDHWLRECRREVSEFHGSPTREGTVRDVRSGLSRKEKSNVRVVVYQKGDRQKVLIQRDSNGAPPSQFDKIFPD